MNTIPAALVSLIVATATPALADTYHFSGDVEITVTAPPGCVITDFNFPTAVSGPAANHGLVVGPITFTSDVACSTPPTVSLAPGSVFVLEGNTLPTNLKIGPTDVVAGTYSFSGDGSTGTAPAARGSAASAWFPAYPLQTTPTPSKIELAGRRFHRTVDIDKCAA